MEFTHEQVVKAFSGLLKPLAEQGHDALQRSDILPYLVPDTGVWVDPDIQGDEHAPAEEYVGFGFFIRDAEDADTGQPFIGALKVHVPSFAANPQFYTMSMMMNLARGIGKMQAEMHNTARKEARKMRSLLERGDLKATDRFH